MERRPLLDKSERIHPPGLSLIFATLCIIDLFGVFPIVTLPKPIIDCGWIGIPLAIVLFSIQIYTAILLGRCWIIAEHLDPRIISKSRYPYAAVAEFCFGTKVSLFVTGLLDLTVFGGSIPNLIYASVNLQLVGVKAFNIDLSFCYWLIILGLLICPILWLGSPKDMKWLATTSVTVVCSVSLLTWICILTDNNSTSQSTSPEINWANVAIAYGILAFQFDIHPMLLTVQVDMAERNRLPQAVLTSFCVTGGLFAITSGLAYLRYGQQTEPNLILMLPDSWTVYVDTCLVTAQIWLSMVVGISPLFQHLEDKLTIVREFNWRRCILRTLILVIVLGIAILIPRFDLVMSLVGGTLTGPLMFVFPPLFYMRLRGMQEFIPSTDYTHSEMDSSSSSTNSDEYQNTEMIISKIPTGSPLSTTSSSSASTNEPISFWERLLCWCTVFFGLFATAFSTYFSVKHAVDLVGFTPPCFTF